LPLRRVGLLPLHLDLEVGALEAAEGALLGQPDDIRDGDEPLSGGGGCPLVVRRPGDGDQQPNRFGDGRAVSGAIFTSE